MYTSLALLALIGSVMLDLTLTKSRILVTRRFWLSYLILLGFQLLTNGWLTSRGIVQYDEAEILGLRIAFAPVEDIVFGFALIVLTLSVWQRLAAVGARTTAQHR